MTNFTDLVLLIGTNPLPNYVAAKYYIKCNAALQKIWLVHSEKNTGIKQQGTYELACNIKDVITEEFGSQIKFGYVSLVDVGFARDIAQDIKGKLISKLDRVRGEAVHLNYTGGTKTMAVHVYRTLEKELGLNCTFSYLNGRDFKMRHDDGHITTDLRREINISLSALMKMHGYEKLEEQNNPEWPDTISEFSKIIETGNLDQYLTWKRKVIRSRYYSGGEFITKKAAFIKHNKLGDHGRSDPERVKQHQKELLEKTPDQVMALLKSIPPEYALLDQDGEFWVPVDDCGNKYYNKRLKKTIADYLDGKWLESYVYSVLKEKMVQAEEFKNKPEIPMEVNWVIIKEKREEKFELDVIVINGYQVCGISCTTSSARGVCKEKGFEVLHRVGQIGGDEAKAVLVTCLSSAVAESVAEDLRVISGSSDNKLLVLGLDDLPKDTLWPLLKDYIWG